MCIVKLNLLESPPPDYQADRVNDVDIDVVKWRPLA